MFFNQFQNYFKNINLIFLKIIKKKGETALSNIQKSKVQLEETKILFGGFIL